MEDLYNRILTFLPTKDLKDHRLSPDFYTQLIERDFPLATSKDPRERYLGLKKMDLISKGQMYILVKSSYLDVGDRKVFVSDSAIKRALKGEPANSISTPTHFYIYSYKNNQDIQLLLDYIHGKIEDYPSLIISKNRYKELPFSWDMYFDIVMAYRKVQNMLHTKEQLTQNQLAFISQYKDQEDLFDAVNSGIRSATNDYVPSNIKSQVDKLCSFDGTLIQVVDELSKRL